MKELKTFERLQLEDRRAEYEKRRLSDFALEIARKCKTMPFAKLHIAASLKDHEGEVGYVGRAAYYELKRRGFRV